MSSNGNWRVLVTDGAAKQIRQIPRKDRDRVEGVIGEIKKRVGDLCKNFRYRVRRDEDVRRGRFLYFYNYPLDVFSAVGRGFREGRVMEIVDSMRVVAWATDVSLRAFVSVLVTLGLLALPFLRPLSGQRRVTISLQEVWHTIVWVTVFAVLITMAVNMAIDRILV